MITSQLKIRIVHEKFGTLLEESFADPIQFKIFLQMVQGCIELKNDLTFFNGIDFMIHVPFKHLVESIVIAKPSDQLTAAELLITKSKIEAEKIK